MLSRVPCARVGFPGGLEGKECACNAGDQGSIPGSGRSPGEGNGTHSSALAWEFPGQRSLDVPSSRPLLFIHFKYSSAQVSVPDSQPTPPPVLPRSNVFKVRKKQVFQLEVKNEEKKNWEANQKHVGMETIGSVRLTGLNVRDKLSKMRNFSC